MNKVEQLQYLSLLHDAELIAITETWLHSDVKDEEVFPGNYSVIRKDRATRGGGVARLVKKPLRYETVSSINGHESVWCKLFLDTTILMVGVIYRTPRSPVEFLYTLDQHLNTIRNARSRIILAGDFNLPGVDWNARITGLVEKPSADTMLEIMLKHNLVQVVKEPTRTQGQNKSTLDLLFLTDGTFNCNIDIQDGISDHKTVVATLTMGNIQLERNPSVHVYNFNRADDTSVTDYLECALDNIPVEDDINRLWKYFVSVVRACLEKYVPKKAKRIGRRSPWVTRDIIHLKRRLNRARKRMQGEVEK